MSSRWSDYRLFLREFGRTFHSTGALLPSGKALCCELARFAASTGQPRRILEVGPGTGVVTDRIIRAMGPSDRLDLVELNDRFVALLQGRLQQNATWKEAADRVRIIHAPIEDAPSDRHYEAIVSGLPLNNFRGEAVRRILRQLQQLASPGATLSFFEYVAVRKLKSLVSGRKERARLASVEQALCTALDAHARGRRCILANLPPAWVHHLQFHADDETLFASRPGLDVSACTPTPQAV